MLEILSAEQGPGRPHSIAHLIKVKRISYYFIVSELANPNAPYLIALIMAGVGLLPPMTILEVIFDQRNSPASSMHFTETGENLQKP